ncbi:hypothetical protein PV10_01609 [Exophiala mesophila]|uniref:Uncharacterized protein n=1 Tax=Exophiala mesophila TaxID=212818 RepID=A0A0D1ZVA6_EXOME|nr:uncharacterized protein PV10_01609 [Exophiala mesophila]KIV97909.1 hypothetical protein PV10_01609 [Exophiala mesophila]
MSGTAASGSNATVQEETQLTRFPQCKQTEKWELEKVARTSHWRLELGALRSQDHICHSRELFVESPTIHPKEYGTILFPVIIRAPCHDAGFADHSVYITAKFALEDVLYDPDAPRNRIASALLKAQCNEFGKLIRTRDGGHGFCIFNENTYLPVEYTQENIVNMRMSSGHGDVVFVDENGTLNMYMFNEASNSAGSMPPENGTDHQHNDHGPDERSEEVLRGEFAGPSASTGVDSFISIDERGYQTIYQRLRLPEATRSHRERGLPLSDNGDMYPPSQNPSSHTDPLVMLGPNPGRRSSSNRRNNFRVPESTARAESQQSRLPLEGSAINGWILNAKGYQHKCNDHRLFRQILIPNTTWFEEGTPSRPYGTVVLPILPGIGHQHPYRVSVMTLSNVVFTPEAKYSEMSWPLLRAEGFRMTRIFDDMHLFELPAAFAESAVYAIWHRSLPGVHWFYANEIPGHGDKLGVLLPLFAMEEWRRGIVEGRLGTSAEMQGPFAWTEPSECRGFGRALQDSSLSDRWEWKYFGWVDGRVVGLEPRCW